VKDSGGQLGAEPRTTTLIFTCRSAFKWTVTNGIQGGI